MIELPIRNTGKPAPGRKKILMISPARRRNPNEDFLFKMSFLNLPYIAAVTPPVYDVEIVDEEYQEVDLDARPWLVALSAQTPVAPRAYALADAFREKGVPVVMGGAHASAETEEALGHVDAVVIGEGEFLWPELLEDLEAGALKPVYRDDDRKEDARRGVEPRRDLLNPHFYTPLTMVETTRGCPHRCDFCGVSRFFGHRYRKRPLAEVEAELRRLFQPGLRKRASRAFARLGWDLPYFLEKRLVYFIDSNFAADQEYTRRLMDLLEEIDLLWWAHATVDAARDDSFLEQMNRSGCIALNIGFESLSKENLRAMHKPFSGFDYRKAIQRIHENGIGIMGTFVVGFDGEGPGIFDEIISFVEETRLDWALVFIRTPYPGTSLFEDLERQGRILTRNWALYDTLNCVFAPNGMTPEDLEAGLRRTWKSVFSLGSIYRRILRSPRVHPMFYLMMNLQFHRMVRTWQDRASSPARPDRAGRRDE